MIFFGEIEYELAPLGNDLLKGLKITRFFKNTKPAISTVENMVYVVSFSYSF